MAYLNQVANWNTSKRGGFYKVLLLANIEATLEPAYVYESMQSNDFWIRPKAEMEDGRFVLISS